MSKILKYQKKNLLNDNKLNHKTYLRDNVLSKKNTFFLDNSQVYTSQAIAENKRIFSLNVKTLVFKNNNFAPLKFYQNVAFFQNDFTFLLLSLNKALFTLNCLKIENTYLFLLKPLKAGFRCFFNGLFGFVLLKTLEFLLFAFEVNVNKFLFINKLFFLNNFYKNYLKLLLKPTLNVGFEFAFLPSVRKKQFSKSIKTLKVSNSLNIIFFVKD